MIVLPVLNQDMYREPQKLLFGCSLTLVHLFSTSPHKTVLNMAADHMCMNGISPYSAPGVRLDIPSTLTY